MKDRLDRTDEPETVEDWKAMYEAAVFGREHYRGLYMNKMRAQAFRFATGKVLFKILKRLERIGWILDGADYVLNER
jgi:ribosomal protein S19E (S16A)